jgi:recombination protein RecT
MSEQTQALAQTPKDLRALINSEKVKTEIIRALPSHVTPDRFIRVMLTALTKNPKLLECTQESVMRCMMEAASIGLELDGRRAHPIPYFDGKLKAMACQLIVDYKGLVEVVRRSGDVSSIRAELVCENDEFGWVNGEITHEIDWRKPRGNVQAVYAIAKLKSGEVQSSTLTKEEVESIRARSKSPNAGPWASDWGEMAKKTAVRRLTKMLPFSPEVADVLEKDEDFPPLERNVTPSKGVRVPVLMPSLPPVAIEDAKESPAAEAFWASMGELPRERILEWLKDHNKTPETATKADVEEIEAYCF